MVDGIGGKAEIQTERLGVQRSCTPVISPRRSRYDEMRVQVHVARHPRSLEGGYAVFDDGRHLTARVMRELHVADMPRHPPVFAVLADTDLAELGCHERHVFSG